MWWTSTLQQSDSNNAAAGIGKLVCIAISENMVLLNPYKEESNKHFRNQVLLELLEIQVQNKDTTKSMSIFLIQVIQTFLFTPHLECQLINIIVASYLLACSQLPKLLYTSTIK